MGLVHKLGISPNIQEAFLYFACLTCALFWILFDDPRWGIIFLSLLAIGVVLCLLLRQTTFEALFFLFFYLALAAAGITCLIGLCVLKLGDPAMGGSIMLQAAVAFAQPIMASVACDKMIKPTDNKVNRLAGWVSIAALYLTPFFVIS